MIRIMMGSGYESREKEAERLPGVFETQGESIHEGRNSIKLFDTPYGEWNVKRYHLPALFNRVIYSFFRKPKGLRAFIYSMRVLESGFETPRPVAYIEERRRGLIGLSYFISEQSPYSRRFYEFGNAKVTECKDVLAAFARFTARLHEAGIYHRDYSPGNILFDEVDCVWHFSIVDINRMEFGPVSVKKGCRNFARLWGQPEMFYYLAEVYAQERNADADTCKRRVMEARNAFWKSRAKNFNLPFKLNF